ncbi:PQQ-dependent sugar dehydrogenase [Bauldia litoralis]|uniref:PQQ-dependent sugar dehydrogenase n=1 Tax=Bauldia litoralis TaxID=665467 RepID=UPI003267C9F2
MIRHSTTAMAVSSAVLVALTVTVPAAESDMVLRGEAAYGNWKDDAPGVWRKIVVDDLPSPGASSSSSNAPGLVSRPDEPGLKTIDGFTAEMVADGFAQPRVIRTAPNGDLFIADSSANEIRVLRIGDDSSPQEDSVFASDLDQPYGIAFYPNGDNPEWVYVANTDSVVRFPYSSGDLKATGAAETVVAELPTGYHWTRDLAFSSDGSKLFVAVGSGSNIAEQVRGEPEGGLDAFAASQPLGAMWGAETDRGAVLAFNPDGTDRRIFATGIRNCSGLATQPATGVLWCVTNERDGLGDNLPPDYATAVGEGQFFGWPWFYIGNNEDPRLAGERPDLAGKVTVPDVLFQPHSAPLGITFYDGDTFPADYAGDAFVAMHGSWNRGKRTGYKIVRLDFENGEATGAYQDFVTGFVESAKSVWGRPVGVAVGNDGALYFTEDGSGSIWRVSADRDGA